MIRLVLTDDHPLVLLGIQSALDSQHFQILATCEDGASAIKAVRRHRPDILVLDLQMPVMDGLSVLRHLRRETAPTNVVIVTGSAPPSHIQTAIELGARGVVSKSEITDRLVECLHAVHEGKRVLPSVTLRDVDGDISARLTERELEIASMVAAALPNKRIGLRLGITEGTVKVHLHRIYEKLQISGRMSLMLRMNGMSTRHG